MSDKTTPTYRIYPGDRVRAYKAEGVVQSVDLQGYTIRFDGEDSNSFAYAEDAEPVPAPPNPVREVAEIQPPGIPDGWEATGEVRAPEPGENFLDKFGAANTYRGEGLQVELDGPIYARPILRRKPSPAPDATAGEKADLANDIHQRIMNIQAEAGNYLYKTGHRDARHAAAEMAMQAVADAHAKGRREGRDEYERQICEVLCGWKAVRNFTVQELVERIAAKGEGGGGT